MRIVAIDLRISFGSRHVLKGLNFAIDGPGMRAITGPSGSGKSVLLELLAGLRRPDGGSVTVDGAAVDSRRFAWIPQRPVHLARLTAAENALVALMPKRLSSSDAGRRVCSVLESVGLAERSTARAMDLSGGESQRLSLAKAWLSGMSVILADEPTGQLDEQMTTGVVESLLALGNERILVVATHDRALAKAAPVSYELRDGRLGVISS